jgi:hypothetical protein
MNIVVAASVAATPQQSGWTWAVLQYLLGFRQLGHHVTFIDSIDAEEVRPRAAPLPASRNAAYFLQFAADFDLLAVSALFMNRARQTIGLQFDRLKQIIRETDVLINISGKLRDADLTGTARRAVYVDVDPAFTQLWHSVQQIDMGLDGHTHFVTIGQNINHMAHEVPTLGREWIGTVPPVVLEKWPVSDTITWNALTTVGNWRGYGSITHNGVHFGQKAHALRQIIALPRKTKERFLLALAIDPGERRDLEALAENGWKLVDPLAVTSTRDAYQAFVSGSKAEFALAKSGYVESKCGWFSDRSVCYLASGRPVIAHDTGFGAFLPTGAGLFKFTTEDDVLASIEALNLNYQKHAHCARQLAEEYFDSRRVLSRLLANLGAA